MTIEELDDLGRAHKDWAGGAWIAADDGSGELSAIYADKLFDKDRLIATGLDDSAAILASLAVNSLPELIRLARLALSARVAALLVDEHAEGEKK